MSRKVGKNCQKIFSKAFGQFAQIRSSKSDLQGNLEAQF